MKNKKGMSLIVLIITIIVVIIIAAVVILTLSSNNPVTNAKEATFKNDIRSFQDELAMYLSNEIIKDYAGTREKIETADLPSTDVMKTYISSFSKKYENKIGIYEDELVYYKPTKEVKNKVTEKEEKWLQDLGIKLKAIEFEWGSDDPNNSEYHTLKKYIGKSTEVVVPKRCHKVGKEAFKNNEVITSVVLQEGVIDIGDDAFGSCSKLKSVSLPTSLEMIGSWSFSSCRNLTNITIPPKVKAIFTCTFASCYNLEEVNLPDNLFGIHEQAFSYCNKLKNIVLPESVGYLAEGAFEKSGLTSIYIPENLTNIDLGAFSNCKDLKNITVDKNNSSFTDVDGVLYNKYKTNLVQFPAGKEITEYTVLNETTEIENHAFYGCEDLTKINLQNNLKIIGMYAFMYCTNLKDINIPSSVEEIRYNSFGLCNNLTQIYIPSSVTKIGGIAFHMCYNLTINCEIEEGNKPSGWSNNWYGGAKTVNWGVTQ